MFAKLHNNQEYHYAYQLEKGINSSIQACYHQGAVKYPFTTLWVPLMYLTYATLQYAFSTTRNSSKLVVARVYCLLSLCDVDTPLHSAVYKYFLLAAEMCAYLHAVQNHIFRVVILSERRGMDYIVHTFDSVGLENISFPITCSRALKSI